MAEPTYDELAVRWQEAQREGRSRFDLLRARLARSPRLRRAYDATYGRLYVNVFSSSPAIRALAPHLEQYRSVHYSPNGAGLSNHEEVRRLARLGVVTDKRLLLIGVEYGQEVDGMWARHRPSSVTGIDIGAYEDRWAKPSDRCLPILFSKMDAAALGFQPSSFDLVYSQGVLPHILDVPAFLDDAHRVLRPDGIFYAFCCPLWHTYGGSHVYHLGYDHLVEDPAVFLERATAVGDGSHWWLEQGLFNKLRFRELYDLVAERFELVSVSVVGSADGRRVKRTEASTWASLRERYSEEDLMIRLVSFTARKRA